MSHFIKKCMSNTLPTMPILQRQGNATTNLCPCCGVTPEIIKHIYQFTHEGSHNTWTALVDALRKYLEARNTDPDNAVLVAGALLYITGERNYLPQCPILNLHSDILQIFLSSIILGIIPTSLVLTQKMYFTHVGNKKRD